MTRAEKPRNPFHLGDRHTLGEGKGFIASRTHGLQVVIYLERLKRVSSTERGLQLAFSPVILQELIELSREAADQMLQALQIVTNRGTGEEQLTLTVLGHQVMQAAEAKGLLLRTKELGDVVFSLPQAVLQRLITDLVQLISSPISRRLGSGTSARAFAWQDRVSSSLGFPLMT